MMNREKEISNLVHVLQQTARMCFQAEWTGSDNSDVAALCMERHNRILAKLKDFDPGLSAVFDPLPQGSSLTAVAIACRQLAAYYEDELGWPARWKQACESSCDSKTIKDFWRKSSKEVRDLGEYMRECTDEWARRRKAKAESDPKDDKK
jgi:hypothetical protein